MQAMMMPGVPKNSKYHEEEMGEDAAKHHLVQGFNKPSGLMMPGTQVPMYAQPCIELLTLEKLNGAQKRKAQVYREKKWKYLQTQIFNLLERPRTKISVIYHAMVFLLILASLLLSVLITIARFERDKRIQDSVYFLEVSLMIVFTIEYILRIWSCSCHGNYKGFWGKLRFIRKPYMVIDIIVIVATAIVLVTTKDGDRIDHFNVSMFRFLRFLQVLRILRLDRQRGAFKIVSQIFYEHRQELLTCWYMSFILLIACSFLVYLAEKSDDKESGDKEDGEMQDLGEGIYWGMITLLTIGYGDIGPKNWMAKIITCIFSFIGTAFFALPAGILGSGFALQVAQNQKLKHFNRRRLPAAVAIQYAWRLYAASSAFNSEATWKPHQIQTIPAFREKKYSTYYRGGSPGGTPQTGRKSMTYFMKKLQNNKSYYVDGDTIGPTRSSIGATIPSALELRDNRSHSEGNLLLIGPDNIDDNQATIVSLPPTMMTDYTESFIRGKNYPTLNGVNSTQDIHLKPLAEAEKTALRFMRKVKLFIAIRKFKEERRPYDVKDVIEQYTEGQMDMFGFIKKFQSRVESAIGVHDDSTDQGRSVKARLSVVEKKVDDISEKLDHVISLLNDGHHCRHHHHRSGSKSSTRSPSLKRKNCTVDQPDYLHPDSAVHREHAYTEDYVENGQGLVEPHELKIRIEQLKDDLQYNSQSSVNSGSSGHLSVSDRHRADSRFTVIPTALVSDKKYKSSDEIDASKRKQLNTENEEEYKTEDNEDSVDKNLEYKNKLKERLKKENQNLRQRKYHVPKSVSFPSKIDEYLGCHSNTSVSLDALSDTRKYHEISREQTDNLRQHSSAEGPDENTHSTKQTAPYSLSKLFKNSNDNTEKPVSATHLNGKLKSGTSPEIQRKVDEEKNNELQSETDDHQAENENNSVHCGDVIVNPTFEMKC